MRIPINNIINFVLLQSNKYNIDESHSLNHALSVLSFSKNIYNEEVKIKPVLKSQRHIIFTSALIHDTCDSKYIDDHTSISNITTFLNENMYSQCDIDIILKIIQKMSYHKIKKDGFPDINEYNDAFHIVREADLLAAYEFNRAVLYGIHKMSLNYKDSFVRSKELYFNRMDKHIDDGLFLTSYGKKYADFLNKIEINNINMLTNFIEEDTK